MKMGICRGTVLALALALLAGIPQAWAFYPLGGYNSAGILRLATWRLDVLDTNHDGDVNGPNEGVPLIFESGPLGFTDSEITTCMAGFETWEGVTTSYMAYYYAGKTKDPLETDPGFTEGAVDGINYVAFEFSDTDDPDNLSDALAIAIMTFVLEDTTITIGNQTVAFTGGQMVEVDFILDGDVLSGLVDDSVDFPGSDLDNQEGLQGVCATLGGFGMGLSYSPLYNFTDEFYDEDGLLVSGKEDRVVYLLDQFGVPQHVGVTPTMFSVITFGYADGTQSRIDLAPDDIAGASYLYPRANQSNFFTLRHEARTTTRPGIQSAPLEGAHIVAWCDADNSGESGRVPFIDTLTGLYEPNVARRGHFSLINLFKQLPDKNGVLFEPTYTITCSPLEPKLTWGQDVGDFDSTHGGAFFDLGQGSLSFASQFTSEVFREGGNILDDVNAELGTPLVFSAARNQVISAESLKTLSVMLPGTTPMFGHRSDVCFYNVVVGSIGVLQGPDQVRYFRDTVLLPTALGTAIAEAYYRISPVVVGYLNEHPALLATAQTMARALDSLLAYRYAILALLMATTVAVAVRRRPRAARVTLLALVAASPMLLAMPADAQMLPLSQADLVKGADEIVVGKVVDVNSHWTEDRRIVTDVTVSVDEVVKGSQAKGGQVTLQVLGGQVDKVIQFVTFMPKFEVGEEVVLFLARRTKVKDATEPQYRVKGNFLGKQLIKTDPETHEKFVVKPNPAEPPSSLVNAPKTNDPKSAEAEKKRRVPLTQHLDRLRDLVQEQAAQP